jgi:2-keto-4-pentenoate hydratase
MTFYAGVVLGPTDTDWRRLDLVGIDGRLLINGTEVGRSRGGDILGHPFDALVWLPNQLGRYGQGLRAGELVMTGSIVTTQWGQPGDQVTVVLEGSRDGVGGVPLAAPWSVMHTAWASPLYGGPWVFPW